MFNVIGSKRNDRENSITAYFSPFGQGPRAKVRRPNEDRVTSSSLPNLILRPLSASFALPRSAKEGVITDELKARVFNAITKPAAVMPMSVNTALMNSHLSSTTLAASGRQVFVNMPGAVEFCKPQSSGVRMLTSWAPTVNSNMQEIPTSEFSDSSFAGYHKYSAYTRLNRRGELIIAPTWVLSEYLLYSLVNGKFPDQRYTEQVQTSGAIVDACFANAEEAGNQVKSFLPPPANIQTASNELVLEALMPYAHGLVVLQGEFACKNFVRVFTDRNVKISAQEIQHSFKLTDEEVDWIMYPVGHSMNTIWGLYAHKDENEHVHLVACVPSLTNLVPYSTRPVSPELQQRFAHALAALVIGTRNLAGLPSTAAVETIATDFLNCLLPEHAKRAQSLLSGPFTAEHPLGPQFFSPMVAGGRAGGLATAASHGEQVRNGGLATAATHGDQVRNGGRKIGWSGAHNLMTADQSQWLHQLCHRKHPESTIGFCWNCKTQLPHGYFFNRQSGAKAAKLGCNTCRKSFTTSEHL